MEKKINLLEDLNKYFKNDINYFKTIKDFAEFYESDEYYHHDKLGYLLEVLSSFDKKRYELILEDNSNKEVIFETDNVSDLLKNISEERNRLSFETGFSVDNAGWYVWDNELNKKVTETFIK